MDRSESENRRRSVCTLRRGRAVWLRRRPSTISQTTLLLAILSPMRLRIRSSSHTTAAAKPFLTTVLGADKLDDGFIQLRENKNIAKFIQECRKLRFWERPTDV